MQKKYLKKSRSRFIKPQSARASLNFKTVFEKTVMQAKRNKIDKINVTKNLTST